MKKKLLSLVMAAAMVLGLAACGSSADTTDTGSDDSASGTTFKIGTIGPLTGENAIYGLAVAQGAKIAVEEINASDSSIKFELQSEDDVADGETSVNAYNNLMDWGMQLLVGRPPGRYAGGVHLRPAPQGGAHRHPLSPHQLPRGPQGPGPAALRHPGGADGSL